MLEVTDLHLGFAAGKKMLMQKNIVASKKGSKNKHKSPSCPTCGILNKRGIKIKSTAIKKT